MCGTLEPLAATRVPGKRINRAGKRRTPLPIEVSIERDGKLHTGSYTVDSGVVTVRSSAGTKAMSIGKSSVARLAQLLLLELAAEHRRETAALNALVVSRRGEANEKSAVRRSRTVATAIPPDLYEIATRLDRIQALADELAKCHRDLLIQMDLATRLQHEVLSARLALNPTQ